LAEFLPEKSSENQAVLALKGLARTSWFSSAQKPHADFSARNSLRELFSSGLGFWCRSPKLQIPHLFGMKNLFKKAIR
jgi:hypothetical protein